MIINIRSAVALLLGLAALPCLALDYVSYQNGPWGSTSTWSPAGVPDSAADNVTINHRVSLDGSYMVNNILIGASGTFVSPGDYTLRVFGAWTNNGAAELQSGAVEFVGTGDGTIGGSAPTSFWKLVINKTALANKVTLEQNARALFAGLGSLNVATGTLVTSGYDFDTDIVNSVVTGNAQGKLVINGSSTVDMWMLQQDYLGYIQVADSATLNVSSWQFTAGNCKFEVTGGAVNYTQTNGWNFRIFGGSPAGCGYIVTGGTVTFYGDVVASVWSVFDVSGDGVIRFAGSTDSRFDLMNAFGGVGWAHWVLNDLRIEKTGGALVRISASGTTTMDTSVVIQKGLYVAPDAKLILYNPLFNGTFGFIIEDVRNEGIIVDSNFTYVNGSWTNNGMFEHGGNLVTFQGSGTGWLHAGDGAFYDLKIDKPGSTLAIDDELAVEHNLTLTGGTLGLSKATLTLGSGSAGATCAVTGGRFGVWGDTSANSLVRAREAGYPYRFEVLPGGTIAARRATFQDMDTGGIRVMGTIDTSDNFSDCTFDHGSTVGRMLKVENTQTIDNIVGTRFVGGSGYNVEKPNNSGHLRFDAGGGNRWGEDFELDPNNLVDWGMAGVEAERPAAVRPALSFGSNPVRGGRVRVSCSLPTVGNARLVVRDIAGRLVTQTSLPAGRSEMAIDLGVLAQGVYMASLSGEGVSVTQKLVVQR